MAAVNCPKCSTYLKYGDPLAGKRIRCPKCKSEFDAPGEGKPARRHGNLPTAPADTPRKPSPPPLPPSVPSAAENSFEFSNQRPTSETSDSEDGPQNDSRDTPQGKLVAEVCGSEVLALFIAGGAGLILCISPLVLLGANRNVVLFLAMFFGSALLLSASLFHYFHFRRKTTQIYRNGIRYVRPAWNYFGADRAGFLPWEEIKTIGIGAFGATMHWTGRFNLSHQLQITIKPVRGKEIRIDGEQVMRDMHNFVARAMQRLKRRELEADLAELEAGAELDYSNFRIERQGFSWSGGFYEPGRHDGTLFWEECFGVVLHSWGFIHLATERGHINTGIHLTQCDDSLGNFLGLVEHRTGSRMLLN